MLCCTIRVAREKKFLSTYACDKCRFFELGQSRKCSPVPRQLIWHMTLRWLGRVNFNVISFLCCSVYGCKRALGRFSQWRRSFAPGQVRYGKSKWMWNEWVSELHLFLKAKNLFSSIIWSIQEVAWLQRLQLIHAVRLYTDKAGEREKKRKRVVFVFGPSSLASWARQAGREGSKSRVRLSLGLKWKSSLASFSISFNSQLSWATTQRSRGVISKMEVRNGNHTYVRTPCLAWCYVCELCWRQLAIYTLARISFIPLHAHTHLFSFGFEFGLNVSSRVCRKERKKEEARCSVSAQKNRLKGLWRWMWQKREAKRPCDGWKEEQKKLRRGKLPWYAVKSVSRPSCNAFSIAFLVVAFPMFIFGNWKVAAWGKFFLFFRPRKGRKKVSLSLSWAYRGSPNLVVYQTMKPKILPSESQAAHQPHKSTFFNPVWSLSNKPDV